MDRIKLFLKQIVKGLEYIICFIVIIGIIIGLKDFVDYFVDIYTLNAHDTYDIFQNFLGHALLLVVGIELVLMILNHTVKGILELVLFVIARKMLIYSDNMSDLLLATISIFLVFVTMKYLVDKDTEKIFEEDREKLTD